MLRSVDKFIVPKRTEDGAGVTLDRVFGHNETHFTDPFLLLDYFWNNDPEKRMAGFPWHPHRGIETITYLIKGGIKHEDSIGNSGELRSGDLQWMTAGSGIIHQEMPLEGGDNIYEGFQLWANLPASEKLIDPRYQDITADKIPVVELPNKGKVKVLTGEFNGISGPVKDILTGPTYLDIEINPNIEMDIPVKSTENVMLFIFRGDGCIVADIGSDSVSFKQLLLLTQGDMVRVKARDKGIRFLLLSGRPLKEPIAWAGPIVMNTEEELERAFTEYQNGSFTKK